ncbi:Clavaminate synthase-like protein [Linderina pennispora]|uniref:Clavaminate synthase-like protein n=1 Tax=Linderina pennispora TaxID=61395 RepID=A0A1Y1WG50_9FUNG|nr:Clavaminate synthase-like protein [Linderina pennispora]ORX72375.1 Clavaminate synthase-like protein [Linderina pennispora]
MIRDSSCSVPFVIKGAISFWPALTTRKWADLEYLRSAVGHHRLVPVELGAKYTDRNWSQQLMPFGEYLDQAIYPLQNSRAGGTGYLAQHNLFAQAPRLKRDFWLPDYTQVETGRRAVPEDSATANGGVLVNAWLGPKGTVSPLHFDKYDNLFAQVVGYKHMRFYAPSESRNVYPFPPGSSLCNTSQVDVNEPDLQRFARFSQARYLEVCMGPGDLLYMPPRWWHYVRSLSTSVSISMWF